jgi:hypothetical protein
MKDTNNKTDLERLSRIVLALSIILVMFAWGSGSDWALRLAHGVEVICFLATLRLWSVEDEWVATHTVLYIVVGVGSGILSLFEFFRMNVL